MIWYAVLATKEGAVFLFLLHKHQPNYGQSTYACSSLHIWLSYCPPKSTNEVSLCTQGVGDEEDDDDVSQNFSGCGFSQPLNETTPEFYNQSQGLFDIQMPGNGEVVPVQSLVLAGDNLVAQPRKVSRFTELVLNSATGM